MKIQEFFLKGLFMNIALGALLTSPGFAMDEQESSVHAAFAKLSVKQKLSTEQEKFLSDFNKIVLDVLLPIEDVVEMFKKWSPNFLEYNSNFEENYLKIETALGKKFSNLIKYYHKSKELIPSSIDLGEYLELTSEFLWAYETGFLRCFLEEVRDYFQSLKDVNGGIFFMETEDQKKEYLEIFNLHVNDWKSSFFVSKNIDITRNYFFGDAK